MKTLVALWKPLQVYLVYPNESKLMLETLCLDV
jgi:hypothetical protein